jgi:hypothetical protein
MSIKTTKHKMPLNVWKIEEEIWPEQFQDCKLPGGNQIATVWLHGTALKNKEKSKGGRE